jgi:hypothetical protein
LDVLRSSTALPELKELQLIFHVVVETEFHKLHIFDGMVGFQKGSKEAQGALCIVI